MLRETVETDLRDRLQEEGPRLYPAYEDYCFGNVPGTLTSALGEPIGTRRLPGDVYDGVEGVSVDDSRDVDVVVVFLVDAFGLAQWREHDDHPVVAAVEESTTVTPITSVFPSETAAAITTFSSGTYPAEHGILGWDVFDPEFDAAFQAFGFVGKSGRDVSEYGSRDASPVDLAYPSLSDRGVDCRHVNPLNSVGAGTTQHAYDGEDIGTMPSAAGEAVAEADDPSFVYVYLPEVDAAGHYEGTSSDAYADVVDETWRAVGDAIEEIDAVAGEDRDVLVAFTADHGMVDTDPDRNVDLLAYDEIADGLARHADGSRVYNSGSPRQVELHLEEDAIPEVRRVLEEEVGAFVLDREEALECELFGDGPLSAVAERRVGDLVALHPTLGMWFGSGIDPSAFEFVGMHGGLHPKEMLVPFGVARLGAVADELEGAATVGESE